MKKWKKAVCLALALSALAFPLTSCGEKPENVLEITVDGGTGEKEYTVSYELYQTIFVYLRGIVADIIRDSAGNQSLATDAEKNRAIKEVAENELIEFYSLVALADSYGIAITEEDRAAFAVEYREKLQEYVDAIDEEDFDFDGTKEEYAEKIYENAMRVARTTPEYYEFSHYRSLLTQRLKQVIGGDLTDYLNQSYTRYKQVIVFYDKGDAAAEEQARLAITAAHEELLAGANIDEVMKTYGDAAYQTDIYFDSYGSIVGDAAGNKLNAVIINAVRALEENETSDIMSGEEDDRLGYFAVYRRLPFSMDYVCSDDAIAEQLYHHSYVGAESYSPHYSRYLLLLESYKQNTTITPCDVKAYNKINIKNID